MRVLVTGNAGSGKSTLAREIGARLQLPVIGLDAMLWQPGWRQPPAEQRTALLSALAQRPAWVIDGVSRILEARADLVVFLEVGPAVCTWRCARRNWRYLFRSRPGLPEGCPEILILPTLLRIIWRFDRTVRPAILARAAAAGPDRRYITVVTPDDRARLLAGLSAGRAA